MKKIFEISWDERKGYHELSSAAVQGMLTDEVHCGKCWNIQVKELSTKKIEKLGISPMKLWESKRMLVDDHIGTDLEGRNLYEVKVVEFSPSNERVLILYTHGGPKLVDGRRSDFLWKEIDFFNGKVVEVLE